MDNKSKAHKRTEQQRESDKVFITDLLVRCIPIREIAIQLNAKNEKEGRGYSISFQQVHQDVKAVYAEWRELKLEFIDTKMEHELAKLDKIESECWEAWERSKEGKRKTVIEGGHMIAGQMSGGSLKEREIETTFGDTKFLDIIQKCMEKRSALLGLNAPMKILASIDNGISQMTKEEIEKELEQTWKPES